jgi:hypothetical protein
MQISRRQALKALVGVAAATTAPVAAAQILVPEEPRRRIWQVGKKLVRPTLAQISRYAHENSEVRGSGLMPIEGQPGLFRDLETGRVINIRDFADDLKHFVHDEYVAVTSTELVALQDAQPQRYLLAQERPEAAPDASGGGHQGSGSDGPTRPRSGA